MIPVIPVVIAKNVADCGFSCGLTLSFTPDPPPLPDPPNSENFSDESNPLH